MAAKMLYREVSGSEWRELSADYLHGAHAMFYAEWPGKFMDKYEYKYAVMVSRLHRLCMCSEPAALPSASDAS